MGFRDGVSSMPDNEDDGLSPTFETDSNVDLDSALDWECSEDRSGRSNHYEIAFATYLRALRTPCVPIDQTSRALEGRALGLKNPDFLLYPIGGPNLIVEVKGKRAKDSQGYRRWENWVTLDDIAGLERWQRMYGPGFRAIFVFVYEEPPHFPLFPEGEGAFRHEERNYRFWAIELDDYLKSLQSRGPRWRAVAMNRAAFRSRVRPLIEWLPASKAFDPAQAMNRRPKRRRRYHWILPVPLIPS